MDIVSIAPAASHKMWAVFFDSDDTSFSFAPVLAYGLASETDDDDVQTMFVSALVDGGIDGLIPVLIDEKFVQLVDSDKDPTKAQAREWMEIWQSAHGEGKDPDVSEEDDDDDEDEDEPVVTRGGD